MQKHTNLPNEITGSYYEEAKEELPWTLVTIVVSAVTVIIVEWTGLADWLLEILV
jgi:hypothetical protein